MNNKAHLRPKDFDINGDIIPMSMKEEKGDLISREALKEAINTYDTFACLPDGKLYPVRELEHPEMFVTYIHVKDVIKAIDNAPTVNPCENCDLYFKAMTKAELDKMPMISKKHKGGAV